MKTKNFLWTIVFVCVGISCSDNLENGQGQNGTDLENGQEAYVKISISTVSDVMGAGASKAGLTRAGEAPSTPNNEGGAGWGEDGNGWLGELPGKNEAKIHDINIFLVDADGPDLTKTDQFKNINSENAESIEIVGQGYLENLNHDAIGGNEPNHDHAEEIVKITMEGLISDEAKNYYVYTIVNAGKDLGGEIKNLEALRNYVWDEVVKNEYNVSDADKFVMSTHKMVSYATPESNNSSVVSISSANTKDNPASTSVYVERLVARIDLAYSEKLDTKDASADVKDKGEFTLTGYMVVNQWQGETNMFKQVTPEITDYTKDVEEGATYNVGMQPKYLGDEVWKIDPSAPNGNFNFVWSKEFYDKTEAAVNDAKWNEKYKNHFYEGKIRTENVLQVSTLSSVSYKLDGTETTYYPVTYVRENTTNTDAQLNGYSTGMIFQTKFAPTGGFKVSDYTEGAITDKSLNTGDNFFFITAEHSNGDAASKVVYANLKSVAARAFNISEDPKNLLKGFMEGWTDITEAQSATLEELQTAINNMSAVNGLEKAFKDYLVLELAKAGDLQQTVETWDGISKLTYDEFVNTQDTELQGYLKGTSTFGTESENIIGQVAKTYPGVYIYVNGMSYHKYWIRHDSNNQPNSMGAMEFAIVRNNVYLLNVTGVRGLGDPLPYTPGKDDPGTPDESNEVTIDVTVYVMDWVKRNNGDIIL